MPGADGFVYAMATTRRVILGIVALAAFSDCAYAACADAEVNWKFRKAEFPMRDARPSGIGKWTADISKKRRPLAVTLLTYDPEFGRIALRASFAGMTSENNGFEVVVGGWTYVIPWDGYEVTPCVRVGKSSFAFMVTTGSGELSRKNLICFDARRKVAWILRYSIPGVLMEESEEVLIEVK